MVNNRSLKFTEDQMDNNYIEKNDSLKNLKKFYDKLANKTKLSIESDLSPEKDFAILISHQ